MELTNADRRPEGTTNKRSCPACGAYCRRGRPTCSKWCSDSLLGVKKLVIIEAPRWPAIVPPGRYARYRIEMGAAYYPDSVRALVEARDLDEAVARFVKWYRGQGREWPPPFCALLVKSRALEDTMVIPTGGKPG